MKGMEVSYKVALAAHTISYKVELVPSGGMAEDGMGLIPLTLVNVTTGPTEGMLEIDLTGITIVRSLNLQDRHSSWSLGPGLESQTETLLEI